MWPSGAAASSRRSWASPFPPMNCTAERRFDDVTLAAPTVAPRSSGGLRIGVTKATIEEANEDKSGGMQFDGGGCDADVEYEIDTGGRCVVFNRAPRGPWAPRPVALATIDKLDGGEGPIVAPERPALLHQPVRTRPMVQPQIPWQPSSSPVRQQLGQWQQPSLPMSPPPLPQLSNQSAGSKSSNGFSWRHIFRRRSVSRSRSSASASANSVATTPQSRSRAPSGNAGGKSLQAFAYTDSKMYSPEDPNSPVNGFRHQSTLAPEPRRGGANGDGLARRSHPAPNNYARGTEAASSATRF